MSISGLSDDKLKDFIIQEAKDLDKADYRNIIIILKTHVDAPDDSFMQTSQTGTHIDLDKLDRSVLTILYSMIHSKLQRIKES